MKEHVGFPLAVFLLVVEKGAFFHWGSGLDAMPGATMDVWANDIYEELRNARGSPKDPPGGRAAFTPAVLSL